MPIGFCSQPFKNIEVHHDGDVFVCCPTWLNKPIGNLKKENLEQIWNSELAQDIRRSIIDQTFKYCNKSECPYYSSNIEPISSLTEEEKKLIIKEKIVKINNRPEEIMLNYDRSCNLSCPSCRSSLEYAEKNSPAYNLSKSFTQKIESELLSNLDDQKIILNLTGSGDPFASLVYREFLENIDGRNKPNLKIDLQTNALLFTEANWNKLTKIHKNINKLHISIDASSKETYEIVRKPGKWNTLIQNLHFIKNLKHLGHINFLQARFVVTAQNYKEMPSFVKMCSKFKFDHIYFSKISDWGVMKNDDLKKLSVFEEGHPEHKTFLKYLSQSILSKRTVSLGNLSDLHQKSQKLKIANANLLEKISYRIILFIHFVRKRRFFLPGAIQDFFKIR